MIPKQKLTGDTNQQRVEVPADASFDNGEENPFILRMLTVGVVSYLAHQIWSKRKMFSLGWYSEEQTDVQKNMVMVFEFLSSMGLIFVMGIVVGITFRNLAKLTKRL